MIGHQIIKLAHQPLVGTEDDGADRARANRARQGLLVRHSRQGRRPNVPEADAQPQLHRAIVVIQRGH